MNEPLWPREHGAYAQLAFPLLSGLLVGGPSLAGVAFALAAIFFFLAYEPASVLLGVRGSRAQRTWAQAAVRRLRWLAPAGLIAGIAGLAALDTTAGRLVTLVPLGLGAAMLPLVLGKTIKSVPGEILLAGACAAMHLPIAYAGGARGEALWGPAVLWFTAFVLAILVVHAIKARQDRERGDRLLRVLSDVVSAAALFFVVWLISGADHRWLGVAGLIPVGATAAVNFSRVSARRLKQVGWTVVAADVATLIVMVIHARNTGS